MWPTKRKMPYEIRHLKGKLGSGFYGISLLLMFFKPISLLRQLPLGKRGMVQLNPFDQLGYHFGDLILPRSLPREGCRSKRCRCRGAGGPSRLASKATGPR